MRITAIPQRKTDVLTGSDLKTSHTPANKISKEITPLITMSIFARDISHFFCFFLINLLTHKHYTYFQGRIAAFL